jgi:hypothetical protein
MFTLHRNHILRTDKGHSIQFEKGKPTWVPPSCIQDVVSIGGIPLEGADGDVLPPDKAPEVELTPEEREAALFDAFAKMEKREERGDFTGNGLPHCKKLYLITGFEVPPEERETAWRKYRVMQDENTLAP